MEVKHLPSLPRASAPLSCEAGLSGALEEPSASIPFAEGGGGGAPGAEGTVTIQAGSGAGAQEARLESSGRKPRLGNCPGLSLGVRDSGPMAMCWHALGNTTWTVHSSPPGQVANGGAVGCNLLTLERAGLGSRHSDTHCLTIG